MDGDLTGLPGKTLGFSPGTTSHLPYDLKQVQFPTSLRVISQSGQGWALGAGAPPCLSLMHRTLGMLCLEGFWLRERVMFRSSGC